MAAVNSKMTLQNYYSAIMYYGAVCILCVVCKFLAAGTAADVILIT
jgi:hypothetical protein